MKSNELKKQIRAYIQQDIPDVLSKIPLQTIVFAEPLVAQPDNKLARGRFVYKLASGLIVILALLMVIVLQDVNSPSYEGDAKPLKSETEILTFSTISATSLVDTFFSDDAEGLGFLPLVESTIQVTKQLDILNSYVRVMEQTLGEIENRKVIVHEESDKEGYQVKVTYQMIDLLNQEVIHTFYYNEQSLEANSVRITGVFLAEDSVYYLDGVVVDEEESKTIVLLASLDVDGVHYVRVMQTNTKDAQIYDYKVMDNNQVTHQSRIVLQEVDNQLRAVLNYSNGNTTQTYTIRKTIHEQVEVIHIAYVIRQGRRLVESGLLRIAAFENPLTNKIQYRYHVQTNNHVEEIIKQRGAQKEPESGPPVEIPVNPGRGNPPVVTPGRPS